MDMSLSKINFKVSKMVGSMISIGIDPFVNDKVLTGDMEIYIYKRNLIQLNKLLKSKVLSHRFEFPISEVTLLNDQNYMTEALDEGRCTTMRPIMNHEIDINRNIFLTPHFHQSFDFFGGYD